MSEDFTLTSEDTRKLFRRPSHAQKCRQLVYSFCKSAGVTVPVADLVRDNPEFRSAEIYRAAKALVKHGILTREDISWFELSTKGKERTHYRCAIKYVEPFTEASRSW